MHDAVLFIKAILPESHCLIFVCDTYLYIAERQCAGKLIYASMPVYGASSIAESHSCDPMYKTAYYQSSDGATLPVTDSELKRIGVSLGLDGGDGIDAHLCRVPEDAAPVYMHSPRFLDVYSTSEAIELADEIGHAYGVAPEDIMLTGGLHLFPRPLRDAHDVDVVLPVDDMSQLIRIKPHLLSTTAGSVCEYGYLWPLRWRSTRGHIVCPFFVYRTLQPVTVLEPRFYAPIHGTVRVLDDAYGIFNAPVLPVRGPCDLIICRSTLLRGMIRSGHELRLHDCPKYVVNRGGYAGATVAVVTDPFKQILNAESILDEYRA